MILFVHKPQRHGGVLGRPKSGQIPLQHTRVPQQDWDDFAVAAGSDAPEEIRRFIRWYLRRRGAKLPTRPALEDWADRARARAWDAEGVQRALAWFADLGHAVTADEPGTDDFGRPEWRCENCGNTLNITAKGRHVSSSGNARCPRS